MLRPIFQIVRSIQCRQALFVTPGLRGNSGGRLLSAFCPPIPREFSSRGLTAERTTIQMLVPFCNSALRSPIPLQSMSHLQPSPSRSFYIQPKGNQSKRQAEPSEFLQTFTRDLTQLANDGKIDPVIGRSAEIYRTVQILARRIKNNPIIIGECGVGKTAIAEGLALRIVAGEVPDSVKNKRVLALDFTALMAGTKFQGEFEERMKALLDAICASKGDIVLFIDEIHMLMGSGNSNPMNASNILKPLLARGELHCIGATTTDEYSKYIEPDAAFARRFQPVRISEPSVQDTISILRGLKDRYEVHHGISFQDSALLAAAKLSDRYITNRFLPDKAIDLIDEAASRLRLQQESKPEEIETLERQILTLKIERSALEKENDPVTEKRKQRIENQLKLRESEFSRLTSQWDKEKGLLQERKKIKLELQKKTNDLETTIRNGNLTEAAQLKYSIIPNLEKALQEMEGKRKEGSSTSLLNESVTPEDIAKVVSRSTGIPVQSLLLAEREKLINMEGTLKKTVVGQDHAVSAVSNVIRVSRAGLHSHERPVGSFLLLGPTGVGKTQLSQAIAKFLFNSEREIIRLDMSEYNEKYSVSRLIGASAGYVGYEEGGVLTEAVRNKPYSIVLFDEIEKAHHEVYNVLLQILDAGHLTDNHGRRIDFKNAIIILTSNLGADAMIDASDPLSQDVARKQVMQQVRSHFLPEFINRLDEIIMFNRLERCHLDQILEIQISNLRQILQDKRVDIQLSPEAKQWLADEGYDPAYGARPLKRVIQRELTNKLAVEFIEGRISENDIIHVDVDPQRKSLLISASPQQVNTNEESLGIDDHLSI